MHIVFDVNEVTLDKYYQQGSGFSYFDGASPFRQRGHGQRGQGVGRVFRNLLRYFGPLVRSSGKALGQESMEAGARMLTDIATGSDVKKAVVKQSSQALQNIIGRAQTRGVDRVSDMIDTMKGDMQTGGGAARRRLAQKTINRRRINSNPNLIGLSVPQSVLQRKRSRRDSLGFY